MSQRSFWEVLGLSSGDEATTSDIRRAYARRLRVTNPEDNPQGFVELREAYEFALAYVGGGGRLRGPSRAPQDLEVLEFEGVHGGDLPDPEPGPPPARREPAPPPPQPPKPVEAAVAPTDEERAYEALLIEDARKLRAQIAELEALLRADLFKPGPAMICLKRLLTSPALQTLTTQIAFEAEIEQILLRNLPAADDLMTLVIERFRWKSTGDYRQAYRVGDGILARQEALYQLRSLGRSEHSLHQAYLALTSRPSLLKTIGWRLTPGLADLVARLLQELRVNSPGLLNKLSPEAVAWWDKWLSTPHLPAGALWALGVLGPAAFLVAGGELDLPVLRGLPPLIGIALAFVCSAGLGLAIHYGVLRPRARWRGQGLARTAPAWVTWGWAAAALALPFVAAMSAELGLTGGLPIVVISLLGAAIVSWTLVVTRVHPGVPHPNPTGLWLITLRTPGRWRNRALVQLAMPALIWLHIAVIMSPGAWGVLTPALIAMAAVVTVGLGSLTAELQAIPRPARHKVYSASGAVVVIAGILVAVFGSLEKLQPWLAVIVLQLALMAPIVEDVIETQFLAPRFAGMASLLVLMWLVLPLTLFPQAPNLQIGGLWLLAGCLVTLALAMKGDRPKPSGKPLKLF